MEASSRLVLLASGWTKPDFLLKPLQKKFTEAGFDAVIIDYPNRGYGNISTSAKAVARYIESLESYYDHICYVGYSMGGIIGRYLIQNLPQSEFIDSYISLASPHNGSIWGHAIPNIHPSFFYGLEPLAAAKQMTTGSYLLKKLNSQLWPEDIPALAISAAWDCIVVPRDNTTFDKAENVTVPKSTHITLPLDPRTWIEIHSWLVFGGVLEDELLFEHPKGYTATALL